MNSPNASTVALPAETEGIDEAIKMVNSTDDGNVSSLYTERGGEPRKCRYEVDAGNIGVTVGVCAPTGFFHFQIPRRYNE